MTKDTARDQQKLASFVRSFTGKRVLVLGDIMFDRFIWGNVNRISPEAPVPIVKVERETFHPGGAGNVLNNLIALEARCVLMGVIGKDSAGRLLKEEFLKHNVNLDGIIEDPARPTIQKIRIVAHSQQIVRVDREKVEKLSPEVSGALVKNFKRQIGKIDAVIISDYGKGVVTKKLLAAILPLARKARVPVMVDPKIEHFLLYKGVTCITPNLKEAMEGVFFRTLESKKDLAALGREILRRLNPASVLITRGEHGMSLFEKNGRTAHIPAVAREVYDVTGAGDTVIGVFTLARASGASLLESAYLSNIAGGIVVGKVGTATVSQAELIERLLEE